MAKYQEAAPIVLQYLEQGMTNKEAAEKAGVSESQFYAWMAEKKEFSELAKHARTIGEQKAIANVEASLLDLALGYEYEEVTTEYESKPNPDQNAKDAYIPVIKKQKRTKKRVVQSIEAIRFYLSNKCPEVWKNRTDGNINLSDLTNGLQISHTYQKKEQGDFPSSESEVDAERE